MLSSVVSFVWASGPIMNAVFTILFLILLRLWTRAETPNVVKKPISKIGEKVEEAGGELKETVKSAEDVFEGFDAETTTNQIKCTTTSSLDVQFFGELFVSGLAAGCLVKYVWNS